MTFRGHIRNGQITLDDPALLPEGAQVNIELIEQPSSRMRKRAQERQFEPIEMPGDSLAEELIRDRR